MTPPLSEPPKHLGDQTQLFLEYLDYYREVVARKLDGLSEDELRTSRLPSGWTPLELLKHLVYMERRWLRWGFTAEPVDAPWGDNAGDDPEAGWQVGPDETLGLLVASLHAGGRRTREIVTAASGLDQPAALGGRFADGSSEPPTLVWILFHVLQEYARHAGHLDIVRELADGETGELNDDDDEIQFSASQ
jgi:uncharacterized damage-inducible protein DinB